MLEAALTLALASQEPGRKKMCVCGGQWVAQCWHSAQDWYHTSRHPVALVGILASEINLTRNGAHMCSALFATHLLVQLGPQPQNFSQKLLLPMHAQSLPQDFVLPIVQQAA